MYVGAVFLVLIPACVVVGNAVEKSDRISDRAGMIIFGSLAVVGFFLLWDFFPNEGSAAAVVMYTAGSVILLVGFQIARGFCWSLLSKQVGVLLLKTFFWLGV